MYVTGKGRLNDAFGFTASPIRFALFEVKATLLEGGFGVAFDAVTVNVVVDVTKEDDIVVVVVAAGCGMGGKGLR